MLIQEDEVLKKSRVLKEMTMKKKIIIMISIILILACAFLVMNWNLLFPAYANFNKVAKLKSSSKLLCIATDKRLMDVLYSLSLDSTPQQFVKKFDVQYNPPGVNKEPSLAITPNNKFIFIGFGDHILKLSSSFKFIMGINTNYITKALGRNFKINITYISAANDKIFFNNSCEQNTIYECDIRKQLWDIKQTHFANTDVHAPNILFKVSKEGKSRRYSRVKNLLIPPIVSVPLTGHSIEKNDLGDYEIIDYSANYGWLYSSCFSNSKKPKKNTIKFLNSVTKKVQDVDTGYHAYFGADDFIYYLKRNGNLFRTSIKDLNKKELVYDLPFTNFIRSPFITPTVSRDRKYLIYQIDKKENSQVEHDKIIVFDLLRKEYTICNDARKGIGRYALKTVKILNFEEDLTGANTNSTPKNSNSSTPDKN